MIRGTCSCGAVAFRLEPPTDFVAHCHCTSCRRASAAAFLTWTSVPLERFQLDEPAPITWYRSSETIRWGFCSRCGTTMLYRADTEGHPEGPQTDRMYVAVGSLLDPLDQQPFGHVSYEEHVPWFTPHDGLPRHLGKQVEVELPSQATHLILYVQDRARSTAFYTAVLDQTPRLDVPGMTEFLLRDGTVLGLMPRAGIERLLPLQTGEGSCAELYLRLPSATDVEAHHQRALQAGARALAPAAPQDWGDTVAYSCDPDGHVLAFASS